MKNLYFAGGCFWCIASIFYNIDGVKDVISGFSGGDEINPRYEDVKNQKTNHRETINIIYDETIASIDSLLEMYYRNVDPFDDGGQFIDRGKSYTLALYYQDENEKMIFEKFIGEKQKISNKTICISIEPFKKFYSAEEYHQHYSEKNIEEFERELIISGRKK